MIHSAVVMSDGATRDDARGGDAGSDRSLDLAVTDLAEDAALHDVALSRKGEGSHSGHREDGGEHVAVICG